MSVDAAFVVQTFVLHCVEMDTTGGGLDSIPETEENPAGSPGYIELLQHLTRRLGANEKISGTTKLQVD